MLKKENAIILGMMAMVSTSILAGCGTQQATAPAHKVALVDHQMVVENHPDMKTAQKAMQDEYDKIQNELKDSQNLPPEEANKKFNEFQKKLRDMEKQKLVPVQESADNAVDEIMKAKGFEVVLDKRAAVKGGVDITKEVLVKEGIAEAEADKMLEKAKEQHIR
ncbi:OmpH family outer membrane protein [Selenomonas montiformis]|uniref:OmpH family outer membrane protein n=1 Tax=Selenomonas montiformis TaxID=2652285 RepID=UPI003F890BF0